MRLIISAFLIICISLTFCSERVNELKYETFDLSDTLIIYYKETLFNNKEDLSIQFYSLVNDSRCPIDVVSVGEGDAEVEFKLTKNDDTVHFSLHTAGSYFNKDTVIYGYEIEMVDLIPNPHSEIQHSPVNYRATIKISKPQCNVELDNINPTIWPGFDIIYIFYTTYYYEICRYFSNIIFLTSIKLTVSIL